MSLTAFAYVKAEKSALYRAIMAAFVDAKGRFLVHLRPEDVARRATGVGAEAIQAALDQLVQWGNLQATPDTGRHGALQAVALQDIRVQLRALRALADEAAPDPARVHAALRNDDHGPPADPGRLQAGALALASVLVRRRLTA